MAIEMKRRRFLIRLASSIGTVVATLTGGRLLSGPAFADATPCIRPPGALPELAFLATCIRCGRCADACPNRCISPFTDEQAQTLAMRPGRFQRNTPIIFPRQQACILCQGVGGDSLLCTEACPTGALQLMSKEPEVLRHEVQMGTAIVDVNLCHSFNGASCGVCVRACPFEGEALTAGMWEKPIINPDACVGCGLCERACVRYPQAIRVEPKAFA